MKKYKVVGIPKMHEGGNIPWHLHPHSVKSPTFVPDPSPFALTKMKMKFDQEQLKRRTAPGINIHKSFDDNWKEFNRYKGLQFDIKKRLEEDSDFKFGDDVLLKQAYAESSFRPDVISGKKKSKVGAQGIAQFMPNTIKDMKRLKFIDKSFNPYDPAQAAAAQYKYMNWLSERPYLNKGDDAVKAAKFLGAYNFGADFVKDALTKAKKDGVDIYESLDWLDTKYLPKETVDYVNKIQGRNEQFNKDFEKAILDDSNQYILGIYKNYSLGGATAGNEFIEIDLSNEEAQMYADGGYVVEELPSYEPGGPNPNPLQEWNKIQKQKWSGVKEWDPAGKSMLKEYNKRMGVTYNPSDHWSAITISNAVMANTGANTKDEIRALGFNPTKSHSGYVSDAFKTNKDPDYKYNKYIAERPTTDLNYNVGDILVKGRRSKKGVGTSKWSYEDFATHGSGYPSHGDIIVDKGTDDNGDYVVLAGGNLDDTYMNRKVYTKDINKKYKVKLKDRNASVPFTAGASLKTDNLGEDVTIDKKKTTMFPDNFDLDFDNDQIYEETSLKLPPIASGSGYDALTSLMGDEVLGVGYTPYQYQFPDLDVQSEKTVTPDSFKYQRLGFVSNEQPTKDDANEVIDPNASTVDEKEDEVAFEPKIYEGDKVYRKDYSDEDKQTVQEIENELKNLDSEMMAEINQITNSEMAAATTEEEKREAAKKKLQMIMSMTGSTIVGSNKAEVDAITKKFKERRKQLKAQLEEMQLAADMNLVDEGKLTEEKFMETHAPGFQKAAAEFEKNAKKGLIWNSFVEPQNEQQAQYGIHDKTLFNSQYAWKNYENRASIKDPYQQEWLGSQDFGRMYGDGSIKYGQWVTKEDIEKKRNEIAQAEYMRQQQDPLGTGQSGRTTGIWPTWPQDLLNLGLTGASWYYAPAFMTATSIIPDAMHENFWQNLYDTYALTFKKRKPGEKGYEEYEAAKERKKEFDRSYDQGRELMKSIAGTNRLSGSQPTLYNKDGGYIVDLDEDEVAQYAQRGYIVEEIK